MICFPSNVKLLSTPRFLEGASSKGSFDNFNLALHVNDEKVAVLANRALLLRHYNLPSVPIWINQTHSNISIDADSISSIVDADASYSKNLGTVCGILTAYQFLFVIKRAPLLEWLMLAGEAWLTE